MPTKCFLLNTIIHYHKISTRENFIQQRILNYKMKFLDYAHLENIINNLNIYYGITYAEVHKKWYFLSICFLGCRLRIWNPFLGGRHPFLGVVVYNFSFFMMKCICLFINNVYCYVNLNAFCEFKIHLHVLQLLIFKLVLSQIS